MDGAAPPGELQAAPSDASDSCLFLDATTSLGPAPDDVSAGAADACADAAPDTVAQPEPADEAPAVPEAAPAEAAPPAASIQLPLGATPSLVVRVQRVVERELRESMLRSCVVCGCDARDGLECDPLPLPPPQPAALAAAAHMLGEHARDAPVRTVAVAAASTAGIAGVALLSFPAALLCAAAGAWALSRAAVAGYRAEAEHPVPQAEAHAEPPAEPQLPRHFVCSDCLAGYVLHCSTPGEGGGCVIETGMLLPPCAAGAAAFLPPPPAGAAQRPCTAAAYNRRALAAALREDAHEAFERARDAWVQNRAVAEAEAVAAARAAAEAVVDAQTRRHITHITENVLTPQCPRCHAAFVDFEGCFALTCGRPACKERFCGWCLQGFGKDSEATSSAVHRHVLRCQCSLALGNYFSTQQHFATALRTRALTAIPRYLDEHVGRRGRDAAGTRAARERDEILARLGPVLRLHNINAGQLQ